MIQGNGDADSVISDALANEVTIGGGPGADTIRLRAAFAATTAYVYGGTGADSIFVNAITVGTDASAIAVAGGTGSDTISFSATQANASGTTLGTLELASIADSDLSAFDPVEGDSNVTGDGTLLNVDWNGAAS